VGGLVILTLGTAVWSASASPNRTVRMAIAPSREGLNTTPTTSASSLPSATMPVSSLPVVHTASTWQVSASYPAVSGVSEIACPSTSVCYAAGTDSSKAGDVLKTTDTGINWRTETLPSGVGAITGLSCPSVSVCFATEDGAVLMTHDSGTTWTPPNIPEGLTLSSIACPSSMRCYAVGTIDDEGPSVLETTDSGRRWTSQTVPPDLGDGAFAVGGLTAISCPSTSMCYAVSDDGDYVVSRDSGSEWTIGEGLVNGSAVKGGGGLDPYGDAIACPSTTMCVTNGAANLGPDSIPSGILVTADSGRTWNQEKLPLLMGVFGVACPSTRVCFAIGAGGIGAHEFGAIISSIDAGRSWRTSLDTPGPHDLGEIACPAATTCLSGDEGGSSLNVTTDSGGSWTTRTFPAGMGGVGSVTCPSITVCYAATDRGILATVDSGSTWSFKSFLPDMFLAALACPSVTTCYAIAVVPKVRQQNFLSTTDAGDTWKVLARFSASALACPSTTICDVVGDDIHVTTDSGRTWHTVYSSGEGELDSVSCSSTTTCYTAGTPEVLATDDTGFIWNEQEVPDGTKPVLTGITCASTTICVAVGQDFNCQGDGDDPCPSGALAVLVTRNGGSVWSGYAIPTDDNLNAVACPSDGGCYAVGFLGVANGYAGGGEGTVLSSSDLGIQWSSQTVPPMTGDLDSITCPSATTCFAVGEGTGGVGGLILKASDL
jgi:photosystem II stability/assembly factor-like uncharacterized protein